MRKSTSSQAGYLSLAALRLVGILCLSGAFGRCWQSTAWAARAATETPDVPAHALTVIKDPVSPTSPSFLFLRGVPHVLVLTQYEDYWIRPLKSTEATLPIAKGNLERAFRAGSGDIGKGDTVSFGIKAVDGDGGAYAHVCVYHTRRNADQSRFVAKFDLLSGRMVWRRITKGVYRVRDEMGSFRTTPSPSRMVVADRALYVLDSKLQLYRFDRNTGALAWVRRVPGATWLGDADIAVTQRGVLVIGTDRERVLTFRCDATGRNGVTAFVPGWQGARQRHIDFAAHVSPLSIDTDGSAYFTRTGWETSTLYRIKPGGTPTIVYEIRAADIAAHNAPTLSQPILSGDRVFIAAVESSDFESLSAPTSGRLIALNKVSGGKVWEASVGVSDPGRSFPGFPATINYAADALSSAAGSGRILWVTQQGTLVCFDAERGTPLFRWRPGPLTGVADLPRQEPNELWITGEVIASEGRLLVLACDIGVPGKEGGKGWQVVYELPRIPPVRNVAK